MKKIIIASVISAVVALGVGAGAGWGVYRVMGGTSVAKATSAEHPASTSSDTLDESASIFVSLPETVVSLHDSDGNDHYMLAELAMVVENDKDAEKVKKDEPLYQSIAVNELSDMKYEDIRALKISEIKTLVSDTLKTELAKRKMSMPYKDILVKKVVFQ